MVSVRFRQRKSEKFWILKGAKSHMKYVLHFGVFKDSGNAAFHKIVKRFYIDFNS